MPHEMKSGTVPHCLLMSDMEKIGHEWIFLPHTVPVHALCLELEMVLVLA